MVDKKSFNLVALDVCASCTIVVLGIITITYTSITVTVYDTVTLFVYQT